MTRLEAESKLLYLLGHAVAVMAQYHPQDMRISLNICEDGTLWANGLDGCVDAYVLPDGSVKLNGEWRHPA